MTGLVNNNNKIKIMGLKHEEIEACAAECKITFKAAYKKLKDGHCCEKEDKPSKKATKEDKEAYDTKED